MTRHDVSFGKGFSETRVCRLTVVRGVFLACDHGLRVEKGPVRTCLDVVDNSRLEINIERPKCLEVTISVP